MREPAETMFAKNGDVHLAYQAFGESGPDMLLVQSWVHHVELVWEVPENARFLQRLGSFARPPHLRLPVSPFERPLLHGFALGRQKGD